MGMRLLTPPFLSFIGFRNRELRHESPGHSWRELSSSMALDLPHSIGVAHRAPVGPIGRHGAVGVNERHKMRAPKGIASPGRREGYPVPSWRSWW